MSASTHFCLKTPILSSYIYLFVINEKVRRVENRGVHYHIPTLCSVLAMLHNIMKKRWQAIEVQAC